MSDNIDYEDEEGVLPTQDKHSDDSDADVSDGTLPKDAKPGQQQSDVEQAANSTTKPDEEQEKMILIDSHKEDPGLVFLVYFIQHSRDSKRFLVSKIDTAKREQMQQAGTEAYKPVEFECVSLAQVSEWTAKQTSLRRRLNSTASDEEIGNTKKRPRPMPKPAASKSHLQEGTVHSWNTGKGYGFVKGDETTENVFFHTSRVRTRGWEPVKGERVQYYVGFDDKKGRDTAVDVEVVDWHAQHHRPPKASSYRESEKCPLRPPMRQPAAVHYRDAPGDRDWQHDRRGNYAANKRARNDDTSFTEQYCDASSNCECSRPPPCCDALAVLVLADAACGPQIAISCNTPLSTRCGIIDHAKFPGNTRNRHETCPCDVYYEK